MKSLFKDVTHKAIQLFYGVSGNFISVATRPVYTNNITLKPRGVKTIPKTAIIIQGPIKQEQSFTLETVRLYKKTLLPSTEIIVSTWDDEDKDTLDQLRSLGAHVVTSTKPENRGILNINLQITSVAAGLKLASQLSVEYVLKTRTDTRIYAKDVEEYLSGLLISFPPVKGFDQTYRIIGLSLNTYLYRLYTISDLILYGHISDMTKYWTVPFDTRREEPEGASRTLRTWAQARMVETYLTTAYLERIGKKLSWTLEDSFSALAENFIIIDEQSLDLYWYKYESWKEYRKRDYQISKNDVFLTFRDWLILHAKKDNLSQIPEPVLDLPFKAKL